MRLTSLQDWLYDEGEDATKNVYTSKIEEIRFVAGPIIQRYLDKIENERQAVLQKQEAEAAKKREAAEAKRKAEEEAKKAAEPKKEDVEMKDAEGEAGAKPDEVEEPTEEKK